MEYVRLAPGLPLSSRLGFGCGSIMGRVGREPSLRAIAAAVDAGVTHFDIARLYGYGEAEALLGEALRGRREQVVIASKFGLVAPRAAAALRGLKPLAQSLVAAVPGLRPVVRALVGTTAKPAERFSVAAAQASLEQSLRALRTDYLDILLLHDCEPADLTDELAAFLETQVAAGTIRACGIASDVETAAQLARQPHAKLLFQFANSLCAPGVDCLPPRPRAYIAHSAFRGVDRLTALRQTQPALFRLSGGSEIAATEIYPLMLGYALAAPSVGVVACSMVGLDHLRANLAAVEQPPFTTEEIAEFTATLMASQPALFAAPRAAFTSAL
jgi:aryl-alcohol dehydrogenase-like predicted oxidoreductase